MTIAEQIEALLGAQGELTEDALSTAIFGSDHYRKFIEEMCEQLMRQGRIARAARRSLRTYTLAEPDSRSRTERRDGTVSRSA